MQLFQHASWLFIAVTSVRQTSEQQPTYNEVVLMAIPPTDILILFINYDITVVPLSYGPPHQRPIWISWFVLVDIGILIYTGLNPVQIRIPISTSRNWNFNLY